MEVKSHKYPRVDIGRISGRYQNFKLDFAFNFSKIDNYVDELAPGVESIMLGGFVTPQVRAGIGDKFPVIYGKSYMRNDEGKIVVDKTDFPCREKMRLSELYLLTSV